MLYSGLTNIRDCIAFPKTAKGTDLMTGAPGTVEPRQLKELHVRLREATLCRRGRLSGGPASTLRDPRPTPRGMQCPGYNRRTAAEGGSMRIAADRPGPDVAGERGDAGDGDPPRTAGELESAIAAPVGRHARSLVRVALHGRPGGDPRGWRCPVVLIDLARQPIDGLAALERRRARGPPTRASLVLDPEVQARASGPGTRARGDARRSGFVPPPVVAGLIARWITLAGHGPGVGRLVADELPGEAAEPWGWLSEYLGDPARRPGGPGLHPPRRPKPDPHQTSGIRCHRHRPLGTTTDVRQDECHAHGTRRPGRPEGGEGPGHRPRPRRPRA